MKKNIAVIAGGNSGEYEISLQSGRNVSNTLDKSKFNVFFIRIKGMNWDYIFDENMTYPVDKNDFTITVGGQKIIFDCVFILIHGNPGEDGKLQGYFDMLNIPYVGCNAAVSALTFNKNLCNRFMSAYGITLTDFLHFHKGDTIDTKLVIDKLALPCFVKPCNSGSSVGVSKVKTEEELLPAINEAFAHDNEILIERFIQGREITCGVMKIKGKIQSLAVTEIVSKKDFFDLEAKYDPNLVDEITPAPIDISVQRECESISKNIYKWLGCEGIVRVDYIVNEKGIYFIEINTIPGQTNESIIPKQLRYRGLSFSELCTQMIEEVMQSI